MRSPKNLLHKAMRFRPDTHGRKRSRRSHLAHRGPVNRIESVSGTVPALSVSCDSLSLHNALSISKALARFCIFTTTLSSYETIHARSLGESSCAKHPDSHLCYGFKGCVATQAWGIVLTRQVPRSAFEKPFFLCNRLMPGNLSTEETTWQWFSGAFEHTIELVHT